MQTIQNIIVSSNAPLVQHEPALDIVNEQLQAGQIATALDELFDDLLARREEEPADWPGYAAGLRKPAARPL